MKILDMDIKHNQVTVTPEFLDDFWVLYNVIQRGDIVYSRTTREVRFGDRYERPEKGRRISLVLGIKVESILWDRMLNRLRIHGIVCDAPDEIGALGSHHTLNITLNTPLKIIKERWLEYHIKQLKRASERGIMPIIVMNIDDEGYSAAVLRGFGPEIAAEERISLPGKHMEEERLRTLNEMFKSALKTLEVLISSVEGPIVILGLGFIKNNFVKFLKENAPAIREKIIDIKSVNSSGSAGIYEAMRSGILARALRHARIIEEAEAVEEVLRRLGKGRGDAAYGLSDVERAVLMGAVEEILITDEMFRESSSEEISALEKLIREVEEKGGKVRIISVEHEAGLKIKSLGGIAALLRYPLG
ncbi:mRNA surveillance protein pelota [Candidatus Bathyarchaeota archaeon]|nr:mRNA surveillance protein pelota [Candidatus Bathyarchaeota archaeon]